MPSGSTFLAPLLLALGVGLAQAQPEGRDDSATVLAVVVAAQDTRARVDGAQIALIYRRKLQFWPDGRRVHPLNLPARHPLRLAFSERVLGVSPAALAEFWNNQYFLGLQPPFVAGSAAAMAERVAETRGAVGYGDACAIDPRLRALLYVHPDGRIDDRAPDC